MKFLLALGAIALILALTSEPAIEEKVEIQMNESQETHDSAMKMLVELHEINDSLLIDKYFYNK